MASFGVNSKSGSIQKFESANIKYRDNAITGFRTMVRSRTDDGSPFCFQPFKALSRSCISENSNILQQDDRNAPNREMTMFIGLNELEIEDKSSHGHMLNDKNYMTNVQTNVQYFTITDETFPALVRNTTFLNSGTKTLHMEVLDGLAELLPAGVGINEIQQMPRLREAWMRVLNMDVSNGTIPFYRITQGTEDTPAVKEILEGHFVVAFITSSSDTSHQDCMASKPFNHNHKQYQKFGQEGFEEIQPTRQLLSIVVDPERVFAAHTDLSSPINFFGHESGNDICNSDNDAGGLYRVFSKPQVRVQSTDHLQ